MAATADTAAISVSGNQLAERFHLDGPGIVATSTRSHGAASADPTTDHNSTANTIEDSATTIVGRDLDDVSMTMVDSVGVGANGIDVPIGTTSTINHNATISACDDLLQDAVDADAGNLHKSMGIDAVGTNTISYNATISACGVLQGDSAALEAI